MTEKSGPLKGVRIVEFAGIGPGPFACMLMADMGADIVTCAQRTDQSRCRQFHARGRCIVEVDLNERGRRSGARPDRKGRHLVEGFRPDVMERLGLGPDAAHAKNSKLVYGRMTGWGQEGPLSQAAGHDINYIAITGALDCFAPAMTNSFRHLISSAIMVAGRIYLVVGVLAGLIEARRSGKGQVVDAAMCDGASSLITMFHALSAMGVWTDTPAHQSARRRRAFLSRLRDKDGKHFSRRRDRAAVLQRASGAGRHLR